MLARNFGIKINSEAFERIAMSIPLKIVIQHRCRLRDLEAILFGQADLLKGDFKDEYPAMLQNEYKHLNKKYCLDSPRVSLYFLRMRPASFPTIRLAQLAAFLHKVTGAFSQIKNAGLEDARNLFRLTAAGYWHNHYVFDEPSLSKPKILGESMIDNVIINTAIPMLFAYAHINHIDSLQEKALSWLRQLAPEKNTLTKGFERLGVANLNAFDSQALLQLKKEYCDHRSCLHCAIGNKILKNGLKKPD